MRSISDGCRGAHPPQHVLFDERHQMAPRPHFARVDLRGVRLVVLWSVEHACSNLHRKLIRRENSIHRIPQLPAESKSLQGSHSLAQSFRAEAVLAVN